MARTKKASPDLVLALDFGGSGTKGAAKKLGGEVQTIYMEPEVAVVDRGMLSNLAGSVGVRMNSAAPEDMAIVGVGEEFRAVGFLAANKYAAIPKLKRKKYIDAVYKTLAAVWVMQQRLSLPRQFKLAIALLLPSGEIEDVDLLLPALNQGLKEFQTPTGLLQVTLIDVECYPEGAGIYLDYSKSRAAENQCQTVAVIMVGYRNASVLVSCRGMMDRGITSSLGMSVMVEQVLQKTSGQTTWRLLSAIVAAGSDFKLGPLVQLVDGDVTAAIRQLELNKLVAAIKLARMQYVAALCSWLREVLPHRQELNQVLICGGTADYLKTELEREFPATPVIWHGGVEQKFGRGVLGNRGIDVLSMLEWYLQKFRVASVEKKELIHG